VNKGVIGAVNKGRKTRVVCTGLTFFVHKGSVETVFSWGGNITAYGYKYKSRSTFWRSYLKNKKPCDEVDFSSLRRFPNSLTAEVLVRYCSLIFLGPTLFLCLINCVSLCFIVLLCFLCNIVSGQLALLLLINNEIIMNHSVAKALTFVASESNNCSFWLRCIRTQTFESYSIVDARCVVVTWIWVTLVHLWK